MLLYNFSWFRPYTWWLINFPYFSQFWLIQFFFRVYTTPVKQFLVSQAIFIKCIFITLIENRGNISGILLCLFWNFICTTVAWIAGPGGELLWQLQLSYLFVLFYSISLFSDFELQDMMPLTFLKVIILTICCGGRCANMASGCYLCSSWLSSILLPVVQATVSCNEVCCAWRCEPLL